MKQGDELESGDYFIRADFDNGDGLMPYYLNAWTWQTDFIPPPDTHVLWAAAERNTGQVPWHFADIWKVDKLSRSNEYRISVRAAHKNVRNSMNHVGKSLTIWQSRDASKNHGDAYLCVRKMSRYSRLFNVYSIL